MNLELDKSTGEISDEQLLHRYRQGDESGFVALVERYRQELFHFLVRFAGNHAAADDLFQETFLQVHSSAGTFDITRRFRPWLFTIAANKARDRLRKEKRRKAASLSNPIGSGSDSTTFVDLLEADLTLPGDDAEQEETKERVRRAVEMLPDHQREVLLMAYFHQFAYKQIAEMLQIPLGTVKSRLHAAVGTFAQIWKSQFSGDGQE